MIATHVVSVECIQNLSLWDALTFLSGLNFYYTIFMTQMYQKITEYDYNILEVQ